MITNKAKARLKILDNHEIEAGVLREFLIKELHTASITAINDKIAQLRNQHKALLILRKEIGNEERNI